MALRTPRITVPLDDEIGAALAAARVDAGLPDASEAGFPRSVLDEAAAAIASGGVDAVERVDRTDIELVTIDPPDSTDLDQALHIETAADGFIVHYAIADVATFVALDGAIDREARGRGRSVYLPDGRASLHPGAIGDDAASLLPDRTRSAFLWTIRLGSDGEQQAVVLERATVRIRARLDYAGVQRSVDAGAPHPSIAALPEVGRLRSECERRRGGASLALPEDEVVRDENGYRIERRAVLAVEGWNAQISLLTGMAAARIMLDGGIGILRTMPPAEEEAMTAFRRAAELLGHPWPATQPYGEFLAGLDTDHPEQLAIMHAAASLFRGAAYTAFDGDVPEDVEQAVLAAPYAHTTAPIRRLVDRFVLLVCENLTRGVEPSEPVRAAVAALPALMAAAEKRAAAAERLAQDIIEAVVLAPRIGSIVTGVVVRSRRTRSTVQLDDPAATIDVALALPAGTRTRLRIDAVDVRAGRIEASPVEDA